MDGHGPDVNNAERSLGDRRVSRNGDAAGGVVRVIEAGYGDCSGPVAITVCSGGRLTPYPVSATIR